MQPVRECLFVEHGLIGRKILAIIAHRGQATVGSQVETPVVACDTNQKSTAFVFISKRALLQ